MSTFIDIADANDRSISFQLNYEYKSINLLVDDNERLENDPRSRYGQSISMKWDFTLNSKWAFSAVVPLIHHSRSTISENQNSFGIGDLSVFSQYRLYSNESHQVNISAGIKFPIGTTDHQDESMIILSPDMQSGSGSTDLFFRTAYSKSDFLIPFLSGNVSFLYKENGTNESFGKRGSFAGRSFAFGDEFSSTAGLNYLSTFDFGFLIPDINLKFRRSTANVEQGIDASNSGGQWLSLPLGIAFVPDETKSIRIYTEIPLYQDLSGLQITTDFLIGIQLKYNGKGSKY